MYVRLKDVTSFVN